MKHMLNLVAVCLVCAIMCFGCATTGVRMSDEDMIVDTVTRMKAALEELDIDLLMATFSDDFYHPEVGGKEEGRDLLQMAIDAGYADDGEVYLDDMEIVIRDDGTATVYPIDLAGPPGSVSVELVLQKEADGWYITTIHPDGM